MTELETINLRLTCLIEASKLKQNIITKKEYENQNIIQISKEFESYIFQKKT